MLAHLGERVAYNMKTDLFASILKQDIAFFDQQRTGEIVNRYFSNNSLYYLCFHASFVVYACF